MIFPQLSSDGEFETGQTTSIEGPVSEIEQCFQGLGQKGSWFLNKMVCVTAEDAGLKLRPK